MSITSVTTAAGVIVLILVGSIFWASRRSFPPSEYLLKSHFEVPAQVQRAAGKSKSFSVMTYNVGYGSGEANNEYVISREKTEENLAQMKKFLSEANVDIVSIQEVDYDSARSGRINQARYLAEGIYSDLVSAVNWDKNYLPFPYWPIRNQFGKILSGQATLSKFPILNSKVYVFEKPSENWWAYNLFYIDRLALISEIQIGDRKVILVNIHLEAFAEGTRKKHAAKLRELIEPYLKQPLIIAGDWNGGTQEETVKRFTREKLFKEASESLGISSPVTFPSWKPVDDLDHIVVNSLVRVKKLTRAEIPGNPSDHHPVIAELELID